MNMGLDMRRVVLTCLAGLMFLIGTSTAMMAQNPYSAAYAVNDSIITYYDIDQRTRMLRFLGFQDGDIRQAAVDELIDDRLKLIAARQFGAEISGEALNRGIGAVAQNMGTDAEGLWNRARGAGISREAFEEYFAIQLIWREIVQARFRQAADPTSIDLDNAFATAAAQTQQSVLLAEIALPFAERGEEATIAFATRLARDINAGFDFTTAVQNFSRSPTAANGGVIGWLDPSRLPANIAAEVSRLRVGQVSGPVRVESGILLFKLVSARTLTSPLKKEVAIKYAVLNLTGQPDALALARRMQPGLDECAEVNSQAAQFGPGSGIYGPISIDQVPADIAISVARLIPSRSEIVANGDSVMLVQLCSRETTLEDAVQAQFTNSVFGSKLASLAEGYLLELRRNAIIERR